MEEWIFYCGRRESIFFCFYYVNSRLRPLDAQIQNPRQRSALKRYMRDRSMEMVCEALEPGTVHGVKKRGQNLVDTVQVWKFGREGGRLRKSDQQARRKIGGAMVWWEPGEGVSRREPPTE